MGTQYQSESGLVKMRKNRKWTAYCTVTLMALLGTNVTSSGSAEAALSQYYYGSPPSSAWAYSYSGSLGIEGGNASFSALVPIDIQSVNNQTNSVVYAARGNRSVSLTHGESFLRSRCRWDSGSPGASPGDNIISCAERI